MIFGILAISIVLASGPKFVATDAPEGAEFSLHRVTVADQTSPAIFSQITREAGTLTLAPSYPLSPGESYEARLSIDGKIVDRIKYRSPAPGGAAPQVVRILPDTGKVPANLLKFYLEFDQRMRPGREIFDKIHIVDQFGEKVHSPWRRQELWSGDEKRLTLWIHPGRIKQGVNLRKQLGPVLRPGEKYELILEASIQTPDGRRLGKTIRHPFEATAENRTLLDVSDWKIIELPTRSKALIIETDRGLDPFLARRYLQVSRAGKPIETSVTWDKSQTQFSLSPKNNWDPGEYEITVDEFLEDLAGNTVARVFDTDLSKPPQNEASSRLKFSVEE